MIRPFKVPLSLEATVPQRMSFGLLEEFVINHALLPASTNPTAAASLPLISI